MTKSLRWGVGSLMALAGLVAVTSFVGCSDDEPGPGPVDTDTGTVAETSTDTGSDTGTTDTGSPGDADASETPPFVADRAVTILHASPDYGAKLFCLGAFLTTSEPATQDKPVQALGPIGRPDTTAPTDPAKFTAIPYGAVVPLPLTATAVAALKAFTVVIWAVDTNPLAATPAKKCEDTWATAKTDTSAWLKVDKDGVKEKESAIVALQGCKTKSTATTSECGPVDTAPSFKWNLTKLDVAKPTAFAGGGTGAKVGLQAIHLSLFGGSTTPAIPSFQDVDIYLQGYGTASTGDAGTDAGDAATDAADGGAPTLTAVGPAISLGAGVKYGDVAAKSVGVQLQGNSDDARVFILPKGTASACIAAGACGTGVPLKSFLAGYAPTGGGFKDGQNQFIAFFGSPLPKTGTDPTTATLRVAFGRVDF